MIIRFPDAANPGRPSIFIAGGIRDSPRDWQEVVARLIDARLPDVQAINPRRANSPWTPTREEAQQQYRLEQDHLRRADITLFWFCQHGEQAGAILELGQSLARHQPVIVAAHPNYPRLPWLRDVLAFENLAVRVFSARHFAEDRALADLANTGVELAIDMWASAQ